MPSFYSPDGDDIGYGPGNTGPVAENKTQQYAGPSNHDYNQANGMTRDEYMKKWMSSGVSNMQQQQDWMAQYGGQVMSGNGTAMTPYGDVLDMQIGARTGSGRPGWTNTGSNGAPGDFFNRQINLSNEMSPQQQYLQSQWAAPQPQAQVPQQYYAGSEPPTDKRKMLIGANIGQGGPINSGTASPSTGFYAPSDAQDIASNYNKMNGNVISPIPGVNQQRTRSNNYSAPSGSMY